MLEAQFKISFMSESQLNLFLNKNKNYVLQLILKGNIHPLQNLMGIGTKELMQFVHLFIAQIAVCRQQTGRYNNQNEWIDVDPRDRLQPQRHPDGHTLESDQWHHGKLCIDDLQHEQLSFSREILSEIGFRTYGNTSRCNVNRFKGVVYKGLERTHFAQLKVILRTFSIKIKFNIFY